MGYFGIPFRNGVPIGLGSVVSFGAQQFDPSELFVGGTAGAWYDPSDLSTLFTTSAGTTPVAMPGQGSAVSVGLMLDKSQGLVLGPELITPEANRDFSSDTGYWTKETGVTISGGTANWSATANSDLYRLNVLTVGKWYRITWTISSYTSGNFRLSVGGTTGVFRTAAGTYTETYYAASNGTLAITGQSSATGSVDNISVRELPGNHAIAFNDTTARPELRARVNLLVATATLSTQSVTTQATSYTLSFAGTGSITLSGTATGSYSAGTHTITCTAGTLTLTVSGTVTTADLRPANSGALLPAYQAVVDANTYDTSGFPLYLRFDGIDDSMYTPANLNLSGTDKVAVFAGVRIAAGTGSQNVCEFSNNAFTTNGGFSVGQGTNAASSGFGFLMNTGSGIAGQTANKSVPYSSVIAETFDSAQSGLANEVKLRMDGVAQTFTSTSGTDSGSGNFGSHILNIACRGATVSPGVFLNGNIYSLIIAGSAVSAGNISATEQWVAGKVGLVIP